jgi:hypothetical protein
MRLFTAVLLILIILIGAAFHAYPRDEKAFFRDDFNNLENWHSLYFPQVSVHTTYTIESNEDEHYLKAEGHSSASALVYPKEFNVYEYPIVRWRWKVGNVYVNVDPETKAGDDYPLRIYIAFEYLPGKSSLFQKLENELVKSIYGVYPPQSTLEYVWANRDDQKAIIPSPHADTVRLIALEKGNRKAGTWQEEEIDIVRDYRRAFGVDPPPMAGMAIMNDSDNTGQKSTSYVDFIEVLGKR